jgi:hypothetical protein
LLTRTLQKPVSQRISDIFFRKLLVYYTSTFVFN